MTSCLDDYVLVLNKHYLAIKVSTVRETITVLYKGGAKVIDENFIEYDYEKWISRSIDISVDENEIPKYTGKIQAPNHFIFAPQAIRLLDHGHISIALNTIKFSRRSVFSRDEYTCQYCGIAEAKKDLTIDHIIPKSKGGKNTFINITTACKPCNTKKANRTPEEAGMKLLKQPETPKWKSHVGIPFSRAKKGYWDRFLY